MNDLSENALFRVQRSRTNRNRWKRLQKLAIVSATDVISRCQVYDARSLFNAPGTLLGLRVCETTPSINPRTDVVASNMYVTRVCLNPDIVNPTNIWLARKANREIGPRGNRYERNRNGTLIFDTICITIVRERLLERSKNTALKGGFLFSSSSGQCN